MDREISKEAKRKRRLRMALSVAAPVLVLAGVAAALIFTGGKTYNESDVTPGIVKRGSIETAAVASGLIVPVYEEIMVSPVTSVIMEACVREGDVVEAGTALLVLDTYSERVAYEKLSDERSIKISEEERGRLGESTERGSLEMKIKSKEIQTERLRVEMENERKLDSIGSGTGDRIRQAELAWRISRLELDQLRSLNLQPDEQAQLEQERDTLANMTGIKQSLERSILDKNLAQMRRTLDNARVTAPRRGTVTYLNTKIGSTVSQGEKIAVISDLSRFRIEGEMPEADADKLGIGAAVNVRIGRALIRGRVANIVPLASGGVVRFTVTLDNDADSHLRSGRRCELGVVHDSIPDVLYIPNGNYYKGKGQYLMYVGTEENEYELRTVKLGDSSFDAVEVVAGLEEGERILADDPKDFKNSRHIKIKNK